MYCLLLESQLKLGSLADFMRAMPVNAAASVRDKPGCLAGV
ncbi:hypothetical protein [Pseudomonas sp.]|nr:hypothetical protein [Pseudomonas sp.]MDP3815187.1 hypothetical protein [Pseudomonas sp.]